EVYDFIELAATVEAPDAGNPFLDAALEGSFGKAGEARRLEVEGFCDSPDGAVFRIRFMPSSPGDYSYALAYRQGGFEAKAEGSFRAAAGRRRGPVRVDSQYPGHLIWEGTGEHYFMNGTTAFWLMGWREDRIIDDAIERLHRLK